MTVPASAWPEAASSLTPLGTTSSTSAKPEQLMADPRPSTLLDSVSSAQAPAPTVTTPAANFSLLCAPWMWLIWSLSHRAQVVTRNLHPGKQFWAVDTSPNTAWPPLLGHFSLQFNNLTVRFCSGKKFLLCSVAHRGKLPLAKFFWPCHFWPSYRKSEKRIIMSASETQDLSAMRLHEGDTGSTGVQIALLTARINDLTEHLKTHVKDHSSRRGLLKLVARRRSLLDYLKRKSVDRYQTVLQSLSLRK